MPWVLEDARTPHPSRHRVLYVVRHGAATPDSFEDGGRVAACLEDTGNQIRRVNPEVSSSLVKRPDGLLRVAKSGLFHAAPLDPHRFDGAERGEEVRDLLRHAAAFTPLADIGLGRCRGAVLDPRHLRVVPAHEGSKCRRREPSLYPDLAEPQPEGFASVLGAGRRGRRQRA